MKRGMKWFALAAAAAMTFINPALAEWKPEGTLKLQVAFGAGGSTDLVARVVGKAIEEKTGWNVIVENKPGGGGVAMFSSIAKMKPTGNVMGIGVNMPILVNLHKRGDKLAFNLDSFDYLATVAKAENALIAKADAPFNNLEEFLAWAKDNGPVPVAFDAGPQKLMMAAATKASGAKFNMVSTKGGAEQLKLVLGGQVMAGFGAGGHFSMLKAGKIKVVAGLSKERLSYDKSVKTFQESGVPVYVDPYYYIATTAGTPADAKAALAKAINDVLANPDVNKAIVNAVNNEPINLGPEGTKQMLVGGMDNIKVLFGE